MQGSTLFDQTCVLILVQTLIYNPEPSGCGSAHKANVHLHRQASPCGSTAGVKQDLKLSPEFKAQLKLTDEFCCCYSLMLKKPLSFIYNFFSEHQYTVLDCFSAGPAFLRPLTLLLIFFKAISVCFIRKEKTRTFLINLSFF